MIIDKNDYTLTLESAADTNYYYVHVAQKIGTEETEIIDTIITTGTSEITIDEDSYYILSEIKLPSNSIADEGDYYTDGVFLYNYMGVEITAETLLALEDGDSNIEREDYDYLFYGHLRTYYLDLIKNKFQKSMCNCNCAIQHEDTILNVLSMGFEILDILAEYGQYSEAQRMIEQLSTCSGIVNINCNCSA